MIYKEDKIIHFDQEHFLKDIVKGDNCFICGASSSDKEFNEEHIIPNWILKKYNMHNSTVTLINEAQINYGQYKIPCCKECNSTLSIIYEKPISELLLNPYTTVIDKLDKDGTIAPLIYKWLCLIFFKKHLKDMKYRFIQNRNIDSENIGDLYNWTPLHHIHCMARSHYTNALIDKDVYGTLMVLPAIILENFDEYDYIDNHIANTILFRIGDVCFVAALTDCSMGLYFLLPILKKINSGLMPIQLIEVFSRLSSFVFNMGMAFSYTDDDQYRIHVNYQRDNSVFKYQDFINLYVDTFIKGTENEYEIRKGLENGTWSFLLDKDNNFINCSS